MPESYDLKRMSRLSADIRIATIREIASAGYGHIGGALSIADVLGGLYGGVMRIRPAEPDWDGRDFLVLSKGHCGPALYAALALAGYFPKEELETLNRGGTSLPSHCDRMKTKGIDMTTGSLGQGISAAVGIALANQMRGLDSYTYCIIGDGECQEGQVWEAAELAVQMKLERLIVFLDANKCQLDCPVEELRHGQDLAEKWRAFGWMTQEAQGYDAGSITECIDSAKSQHKAPSMILLDTIKGLGDDFAERTAFNHYMVVNHEMAEAAVDEIEKRWSEGTYPRGQVRW